MITTMPEVRLTDLLKCSLKCQSHNNPMRESNVTFRTVSYNPGKKIGTRVQVSFHGCVCVEYKALK